MNTYSKEVGEQESTVVVDGLTRGGSCTYRVQATEGAPGFNVDMSKWASTTKNVGSLAGAAHPRDEDSWAAHWIEWDDETDTFEDSSWPALTAQFYPVSCGTCS